MRGVCKRVRGGLWTHGRRLGHNGTRERLGHMGTREEAWACAQGVLKSFRVGAHRRHMAGRCNHFARARAPEGLSSALAMKGIRLESHVCTLL